MKNSSLKILAFLLLVTYFGCGQSVLQQSSAQETTTPTQGSQAKELKTAESTTPTETSPVQGSATQESTKQQQSEVAPLISVDDLKKLLEAKTQGLHLLEAGTDIKVYAGEHLPTARFVHWVTDMTHPEKTNEYMLPDADQFAKLLSGLGIKNGERIVIYDRLSSRLSTRLYWTLKYYGHEQVQVLDGGFGAWRLKHKTSSEVSVAKASEYEIVATEDEILAEIQFIKECLADPDARTIDGRPSVQFSGKESGRVFHTGKEHSRRGHIPGAVNIFWKDNFNEDGTFKTVEELDKIYRNAGILPDQCVVTYCNEGLHAAPPWFVLTVLLKYEKVKLYDRSMAEWAESDSPMEETKEKDGSPKAKETRKAVEMKAAEKQ